MTDLNSLLNSGTRERLVADLTSLAENTVSNQSGLTGMALKSAVAAGKKADANAIPNGINKGLPQLVSALQPYFDNYQAQGSASFGSFLESNADDVTEKLLATADSITEQMPGPAKAAYSALRGKAGRIIGPVLPELGQIIERYV